MRDYVELVKGGSRIQLYRCGRNLFQERRSRRSNPQPSGPLKNTPCADNRERDRRFDERLRALLAEGWADTRPPPPTTPKARPAPTAAALEEELAALVKRTIAALGQARDADDATIWRRAIADYGKIKRRAGGDRAEHLVHFFAVDGVGLERRHSVVVTRARATRERKARWIALLEAAGRRG